MCQVFEHGATWLLYRNLHEAGLRTLYLHAAGSLMSQMWWIQVQS